MSSTFCALCSRWYLWLAHSLPDLIIHNNYEYGSLIIWIQLLYYCFLVGRGKVLSESSVIKRSVQKTVPRRGLCPSRVLSLCTALCSLTVSLGMVPSPSWPLHTLPLCKPSSTWAGVDLLPAEDKLVWLQHSTCVHWTLYWLQFTCKSGKPSSAIEENCVLVVALVKENPNAVRWSRCLQHS